MKKYKVIFFGTPEFAVPSLLELAEDENFELLALITQKDKMVGREQALTPPPIKVAAEKIGLQIIQPEKIREAEEIIKKLQPDICVVVAYGQLIPESILAIPAYGFINVHGSILPRYRGASVIQAPILNGDQEAGVTIMKMDKGLDTGPILTIGKIGLIGDETAGFLHDKLARMGARILPKTILEYLQGYLEPKEQVGESKYCKALKREDGRIDWLKKATEIEKQVRAMSPWPGTFTTFKGKTLKIIEVGQNPVRLAGHSIGEVLIRDEQTVVQTGEDGLAIKKLQLEGGKPLDIKEFLRGHENFIESILTS